MARARKDAGSALLIGFALLAVAVAFLGPFAVAGRSLFCEMRVRRYARASRASQLISPAERADLTAREAKVSRLELRIEALMRQGDASGFARRSDGLFDARNVTARDLNAQLVGLAHARSEAAQDVEALKDFLGTRIEAWVRARSSVIGARIGLLVFAGVFVAMTVSRMGDHGTGFSLPVLLFGDRTDGADRLLASAGASLAAALAMAVGGGTARASLSA